MTARTLDIDKLHLRGGAHRGGDPYAGACLLEATAYLAGEPWSDHPQCVSPVLAAFGRSWNDGMRSDDERDSLKQYIPRLIGTSGDAAADERRAWMATDWLVRVCAPAWLRLANLDDHADKLATLQPIANAAYADSVKGEVFAARAAARDAARDAARNAAWAAARNAARNAAWAAARDAAVAAAWAAAVAAARDAARNAAWAAARDEIEPTAIALQESAHVLFDLMILADEVPAFWPEVAR